MGNRSELTPSRDISPSEMANEVTSVIRDHEILRNQYRNGVQYGGLVAAPTTPSAQAAGAGGITTWRVNIGDIVVTVNGAITSLAAQADFAVSGGVALFTAINNQSIVAAIVARNVTGVITCFPVLGAVAVTGAQVGPTDTAITAAVGAANTWVKIAECTLNRTGNVAVTQGQNNAARPIPGVTEDVAFGSYTDYVP